MSVFTAAFKGVWLGLLSRDSLAVLDEWFYSGANGEPATRYEDYQAEAYNLSGLHDWETHAIQDHFPEQGRVLVFAAGGGRELVALHRLGYDLDGVECHPGLNEAANALLTRHDIPAAVHLGPRDGLPDEIAANRGRYDGVVLGWAVYTLIRGRSARIALLRQMAACLSRDGRLLLSFYPRTGDPLHFRVIARVGRVVSALTRGERVELGDDLVDCYYHRFSELEVRSEVAEAGLELVHMSMAPYGHAVVRLAQEQSGAVSPLEPMESSQVERQPVSSS
jgi:hypothetical protein